MANSRWSLSLIPVHVHNEYIWPLWNQVLDTLLFSIPEMYCMYRIQHVFQHFLMFVNEDHIRAIWALNCRQWIQHFPCRIKQCRTADWTCRHQWWLHSDPRTGWRHCVHVSKGRWFSKALQASHIVDIVFYSSFSFRINIWYFLVLKFKTVSMMKVSFSPCRYLA